MPREIKSQILDVSKKIRSMPERIKDMQWAAMVFIIIEIVSTCAIGAISYRQVSLWAGFGALALFAPLFLLFLITLTYGPLAKNTQLIVTIFGMIASNIPIIIVLFAIEYSWLHFTGLDFLGKALVNNTISFWGALYFSIVTWTTLGYGDLAPLGWARGVAAAEALLGYLIMAFLVAGLTSMVQRKP